MKWIRHGDKMLNTDYFIMFAIEEKSWGYVIRGYRGEDIDYEEWGPYETENEAQEWLLNITESLD